MWFFGHACFNMSVRVPDDHGIVSEAWDQTSRAFCSTCILKAFCNLQASLAIWQVSRLTGLLSFLQSHFVILRACSCAAHGRQVRGPYTFFTRSQPIIIASQDSAAGLLPTQVAPTITFATSGASSSDARHADSIDAVRAHSLALVPHHTSTFASPRTAPYMARSPLLRPRFSHAPPSMADVFSAIHSLEASVHILENSQRNMLRRMQSFELSLEELPTQLSRIDRRTARDIDELENSLRNAHERITEVQASTHNAAAADVQRTITQATTNVRQLRLRLGNAFQAVGAHIAIA